jgi:hypothetical protein
MPSPTIVPIHTGKYQTLTLVIQPANLPYIPDTHIGITNDGIL